MIDPKSEIEIAFETLEKVWLKKQKLDQAVKNPKRDELAAEEAREANIEEFYSLIVRIFGARAMSFRDLAIQMICFVEYEADPEEEQVAICRRLAELSDVKSQILTGLLKARQSAH